MTEGDWLASDDPAAMLRFSRMAPGGFAGYRRAPISDRKLRLFAVACCRQVWDGVSCQNCDGQGHTNLSRDLYRGHPLWEDYECPDCRGAGRVGGLTDPRSRAAVEVAERYADGEATIQELRFAHHEGIEALRGESPAVWDAAHCCVDVAANAASEIARPRYACPPAAQAALLREVAGNPFRPMPSPRDCFRAAITSLAEWERIGGQAYKWWPQVLKWQDGTVPRLAAEIYDGRKWGLMPVLADALLDAGCDDEELIAHCRSGGPHVRGYWALDLILGRQ